jgi:hypothetical protein
VSEFCSDTLDRNPDGSPGNLIHAKLQTGLHLIDFRTARPASRTMESLWITHWKHHRLGYSNHLGLDATLNSRPVISALYGNYLLNTLAN